MEFEIEEMDLTAGTFWRNVKAFQKHYELNDKDLAEAIGTNQHALQSCRNRQTIPRADKALKIADVLCTSVEELFRKEE